MKYGFSELEYLKFYAGTISQLMILFTHFYLTCKSPRISEIRPLRLFSLFSSCFSDVKEFAKIVKL
jgi:hypothetical protein